jgi:hypothetical protein
LKPWVCLPPAQGIFHGNGHEEPFITPENERYCAGGSGTRSIKFLEIKS